LCSVRGGGGESDENSNRPITKVTIVGGTHGNEYTGIWCINAIERQRQCTLYQQSNEHHNLRHDHQDEEEEGRRKITTTIKRMENNNNNNEQYHNYNDVSMNDSNSSPRQHDRDRVTSTTINVFDEYPSLSIDTLLANPQAFIQNKRFINVDLNREFSTDKLANAWNYIDNNNLLSILSSDVDLSHELPYETILAQEIDSLLGPKINIVVQPTNTNPKVDIVIDLHTTTSNMGITLIIPEGDALMSQAAAYVLAKCQLEYGSGTANGASATCLMHAVPNRADRMNLSSCGLHGFTIEVGPVPQGVLRHDIVMKTQFALHSLLEFLHLRNIELLNKEKKEEENDDNNGQKTNDDNTSSRTTILQQLMQHYPNGIVPCYRSAPAKQPGELSGKIRWPIDTTSINPNFPAWMVHESIQDCDYYKGLHVGDPLFVDLDGNVITYDGSHGDVVYLIFVNEGGYYYESSGTGVGVAVCSKFDLQTGEFLLFV
jgi:aspartoacylase